MSRHFASWIAGAWVVFAALGCNLQMQPPTPTPTMFVTVIGVPIGATADVPQVTPTALPETFILEVTNQLDRDICYIYESPAMGPNLIEDNPVSPNETIQLSMRRGVYDLAVEDCDHQWLDLITVNFQPSISWTVATYPPVEYRTLTFINHTAETICYIMAGPPNTDGGRDILNMAPSSMNINTNQPTAVPRVTIPPDGMVSITMSIGSRITFQAFTCEIDGEIDSLHDVEITGDFTWEIGQ